MSLRQFNTTKAAIQRCLAVRRRRRSDGKKISGKVRKHRTKNHPQLTDDIISEEIFTKLTVSSLCRFRCVSKLWSSLVINNFHRSTTTRPPIICTMGCDETRPIRICSIDGNTGVVTPNIYNPIDLGEYDLILLACSNGFIYFNNLTQKHNLAVFNPATQQKLLVPNTNQSRVCFGFDPCSTKFKVFGWMNYPRQCHIYTLDKNSSWRTVTSRPIQGSGKFCSMPFCMKGTIYWYSDTMMIVSFNLSTETFGLIQGPGGSENPIKEVEDMFEFQGCLCLAVLQGPQNRIMDLWMLKDQGNNNNNNRWVMIARVDRPLGMEIYWTTPKPTPTGELLLAQDETVGSQSFYFYSLFTRQFQSISICGSDPYCILNNFVENSLSLIDL